MAAYRVDRMPGSAESADIAARLLDRLPSWFGIPEANAAYIHSATELPAFVARAGIEPIGLLLWHRHFPEAAEIHLLAVDPEWHRRGVGRALVAALRDELDDGECRVLQVKTLGPSNPDPGYADTRKFYRAAGFLPMEETDALWPEDPCLIMVTFLDR